MAATGNSEVHVFVMWLLLLWLLLLADDDDGNPSCFQRESSSRSDLGALLRVVQQPDRSWRRGLGALAWRSGLGALAWVVQRSESSGNGRLCALL